MVEEILRRAAHHAAEVQIELQSESKVYKPMKHFKLTRIEFEELHREGCLGRLTTVGWYTLREMPVWIE